MIAAIEVAGSETKGEVGVAGLSEGVAGDSCLKVNLPSSVIV